MTIERRLERTSYLRFTVRVGSRMRDATATYRAALDAGSRRRLVWRASRLCARQRVRQHLSNAART